MDTRTAIELVAAADALAWISAGVKVESACRIVAEINMGWKGVQPRQQQLSHKDPLNMALNQIEQLRSQKADSEAASAARLSEMGQQIAELCVTSHLSGMSVRQLLSCGVQ